MKVENLVDNFKKFQNQVFKKSEELDAAGLKGREFFDSPLKRMPTRYNDTNIYLVFSG